MKADIHLKLCNELRTAIRFMKLAFYRPGYQKFLMCLLIKRRGQVCVSKQAIEPSKHSVKLLKHSAELLMIQEKTKSSVESLKSSAGCLKNSAACLCYNTARALPTATLVTPLSQKYETSWNMMLLLLENLERTAKTIIYQLIWLTMTNNLN